jgi:hypothetical protein
MQDKYSRVVARQFFLGGGGRGAIFTRPKNDPCEKLTGKNAIKIGKIQTSIKIRWIRHFGEGQNYY